jgi:adenosine deaminase
MTDLDLGKEYRTVAEAQGLDFDDLAAVALDGIEASWLDDVDRRILRQEFSEALEGLRPRAPLDRPPPGL